MFPRNTCSTDFILCSNVLRPRLDAPCVAFAHIHVHRGWFCVCYHRWKTDGKLAWAEGRQTEEVCSGSSARQRILNRIAVSSLDHFYLFESCVPSFSHPLSHSLARSLSLYLPIHLYRSPSLPLLPLCHCPVSSERSASKRTEAAHRCSYRLLLGMPDIDLARAIKIDLLSEVSRIQKLL